MKFLCVVQDDDNLSEAHNCAFFFYFAWKRGYLCETKKLGHLLFHGHSGLSRGNSKAWLFLLFHLISGLS